VARTISAESGDSTGTSKVDKKAKLGLAGVEIRPRPVLPRQNWSIRGVYSFRALNWHFAAIRAERPHGKGLPTLGRKRLKRCITELFLVSSVNPVRARQFDRAASQGWRPSGDKGSGAE
jgi:hypothetical protein